MELDSILDVFVPYTPGKKKQRYNWNLDKARDLKIERGGGPTRNFRYINHIIKIRLIPVDSVTEIMTGGRSLGSAGCSDFCLFSVIEMTSCSALNFSFKTKELG